MKKILDINLDDKFKSSLGLIITGGIDAQYYGKIESGNYLEFNTGSRKIIRKIKGVDYFRPPHYLDLKDVKTRFLGLLIEWENEEELNMIIESDILRQKAVIYKGN
ncbi:hypothetical protein [Winogradskyella sp. SYSU M77433]|uniref:hypothetical protein n=1 Tax=Winogradskyella sp. SYSU M77433 TaxID=3042722 RepID=UPI00247FAB28|nr:hypothetical protein [Winogradskyella sp. SYSU M77433]MDH7911807.1 hypothetical protein [Winogradskyella sp. SYSU M77433]